MNTTFLNMHLLIKGLKILAIIKVFQPEKQSYHYGFKNKLSTKKGDYINKMCAHKKNV